MDLIADTSFLVGIWRRQPWALQFAEVQWSRAIGIPWVVRGEFLHGAHRAGHNQEDVRRFLDLGIPVNDPTPVIDTYARVCADLQTKAAPTYRMIGQNDLWIAATALSFACPLVTRNRRHFAEIPGLQVQALVT
jgi:predicted nucleic acid-binding protein